MRKVSAIVALSSLLLTVFASGYLALSPCSVQRVQAISSTEAAARRATGRQPVSEERACFSLLEAEGSSILIPLAIPVALAAAGAVALRFRKRVLVWVSATLLLMFSLLTGFSIGLFYIPSSLLLLLAAALDSASGASTDSA